MASAARIGLGAGAALITLGENGSYYRGEAGAFHVPARNAGRVVETTGAGDAFIGCFAHTYSQGGNVDEAIQQAVRYASHSVTGKGTQTSYASAEEFSAL